MRTLRTSHAKVRHSQSRSSELWGFVSNPGGKRKRRMTVADALKECVTAVRAAMLVRTVTGPR